MKRDNLIIFSRFSGIKFLEKVIEIFLKNVETGFWRKKNIENMKLFKFQIKKIKKKIK